MTVGDVSMVLHNEIQEETYTRRCAKIQEDFALLQEAILFVQLNKLECGSGSVAFLFSKLVPLVQTALAMFFLYRHIGAADVAIAVLLGAGARLAWLGMA